MRGRRQSAVLAPPVTEEVLREIVSRIVRHARPERIVLFGSRAWGVPRDDSDVDLLVVTSPDGAPDESVRERAIALRQAIQPLVVPVDLLVRTPRQVAHRVRLGDRLMHSIVERGRILYDRESAPSRP